MNHGRLFFLLPVLAIMCQGCFLVKTPLMVQPKHNRQRVYLYNIPLSPRETVKMTDSTYLNLQNETNNACNWITAQAAENGVEITFVQEWEQPQNGRHEFIFRLPTRNIAALSDFRHWLKRHVKKDKRHLVEGWEERMLQHVLQNNADSISLYSTAARRYLAGDTAGFVHTEENDIHIFMVYILKARAQAVMGYYDRPYVVVGKLSSEVIAHEILHTLGAHDTYTHLFWIGKRRRIVKQNMKEEIMNGAIRKVNRCSQYNMSEYTRYCMGWTDTLPQRFKPLLKENQMARWMMRFGMRRKY